MQAGQAHNIPTQVSGMSTEDQTVIPMITYEDGIAALEWLANAFGFRECARICDVGELLPEVGGLHDASTYFLAWHKGRVPELEVWGIEA